MIARSLTCERHDTHCRHLNATLAAIAGTAATVCMAAAPWAAAAVAAATATAAGWVAAPASLRRPATGDDLLAVAHAAGVTPRPRAEKHLVVVR